MENIEIIYITTLSIIFDSTCITPIGLSIAGYAIHSQFFFCSSCHMLNELEHQASARVSHGFPLFFRSSADFGCRAGPIFPGPCPPSSLILRSACSCSWCAFLGSLADPRPFFHPFKVLTGPGVELGISKTPDQPDISVGGCHIKTLTSALRNQKMNIRLTVGHSAGSFSLLISTHTWLSCFIYFDHSLNSSLPLSNVVELRESSRWAKVTILEFIAKLKQVFSLSYR